MDHGSNLARDEKAPGTLSAEHAVFTSIRSPLGEGYRLVASSAGISAEEKKEIIRRSPSHGSLCESASTSRALSSYPLASGRHVVALSCFAGREHTGRGQRVYTNITVLDGPQFRHFSCDPILVRAAVVEALGDGPNLKPPARLQRLELSTGHHLGRAAYSNLGSWHSEEADRLSSILAATMQGRRMLVTRVPLPERVLGCTIQATPLAVREQLSVACGLKFTVARDIGLTIMPTDRDPKKPKRHHDGMVTYDWTSPPPQVRTPVEPWLDFVRRMWQAGRQMEIGTLAGRIKDDQSLADLEEIVTLWDALERIQAADETERPELLAKHAGTIPRSEVVEHLLSQIRRLEEKEGG